MSDAEEDETSLGTDVGHGSGQDARAGGAAPLFPGQLSGAAVPPQHLAPRSGAAPGTRVGTEQGAAAELDSCALALPPPPPPPRSHQAWPSRPRGRRDTELSATARWRERGGRNGQGKRHRGSAAPSQSRGRALVPARRDAGAMGGHRGDGGTQGRWAGQRRRDSCEWDNINLQTGPQQLRCQRSCRGAVPVTAAPGVRLSRRQVRSVGRGLGPRRRATQLCLGLCSWGATAAPGLVSGGERGESPQRQGKLHGSSQPRSSSPGFARALGAAASRGAPKRLRCRRAPAPAERTRVSPVVLGSCRAAVKNTQKAKETSNTKGNREG